jgi:hypothetical protein
MRKTSLCSEKEYWSSGIVRNQLFTLFTTFRIVQEEAYGDPEGSQGDGRVGQIKSRPVIGAYVEIKEVDHFSEPQSIYEIPDGPSKYEGEPED